MRQKNKYINKRSDRYKLLSIFRRVWGSVLGVSLLFAFLVLLSWGLLQGYTWLTTTPYFAVKDVRIQGNSRLQKKDIMNKADLSIGINSLKISIGDIEDKLIDMPWIKEVDVRRKLPDEVIIRIQERKPVFWLCKEKKIYYAQANGNIISPVQTDNPVYLPLLYFQENNKQLENDLLYLKRQLSEKKLPFSMAEISWIDFVAEKVVEVFLRDFKILIKIGRENIESNCRSLSKIWRDLAKRRELETVKTIRVYESKGWVGLNHKVVAN